ncbi:MAG: tetratricopeptide repeat protein, partial [Planctomycetales bacterium]
MGCTWTSRDIDSQDDSQQATDNTSDTASSRGAKSAKRGKTSRQRIPKTAPEPDLVSVYTREVKLDPTNAEAYFNRGSAFLDRGETKRAIQDFTAALNLAPDHAYAHFNRGRAYLEIGDFPAAQLDRAEALRLDSSLEPWLVGTILAYELADLEESSSENDQDRRTRAETVASVLRHRLNGDQTTRAKIVSRPNGRIEAWVFGSGLQRVRRVEQSIECVGELEFRILADPREHPTAVERALRDDSPEILDGQRVIARWIPIVGLPHSSEDALQGETELVLRVNALGRREALTLADSLNVTQAHVAEARSLDSTTGRAAL